MYKHTGPFARSSADAWTSFEQYLLEWEPAVGIPLSEETEYRPRLEVQEVFNYDQSVVAYHVEAAPLLLPLWEYEGAEDDLTASGTVQATIAHAAFRHHVLQFNALRVVQPKGDAGRHINVKPYAYWAAASIRRLDDFLRVPWGRINSLGVDQGHPLRRQVSKLSHYSVTNSMGLFDECHPYFTRKGHIDRTTSIVDRIDNRCSLESFDAFPAADDLMCTDSSQTYQNAGRYQQRLFLFLQELYYQLESVLAQYEGGEESGSCPASVPQDVRVQISFPQTSDSLEEGAIRGLHAVVLGLPRWDPKHVGCSEVMLDNSIGMMCVAGLCKSRRLRVYLLAHSMRGWPPVAWYCGVSFTRRLNEIKMTVAGIEPSGLYEMSVAIWTNVSASSDDGVSESSADELLYGSPRTASAVAIFNVEFPTAVPATATTVTAVDDLPAAFPPDLRNRVKADSHSLTARKVFLYLVQSDACLDLGHLRSDRAEVLQLVWKVPPGPGCGGAIYYPNSTLVQGRNRLYAAARESFPGSSFSYYIMMDGDVTLREVRDFGFNTGSAWATFEEYLLEWEPAVGFPHFGAADYDDESEVQLVFNFDQIVVAYHAEAAGLLLPYTEAFDGVSWWYCGTVQNALCAAVYNDHRIQFNALRALSWASNPSPTYLRASNFLLPLAWIGSAITSLDALMAFPWYAPFHSATPKAWDTARRAWRLRGTPSRRGAARYDSRSAGGDKLDFCHEYFRGRGLDALCDRGGAEGRYRDGAAVTEQAVVDHLEELWARATALREDMEALGQGDLAGRAGAAAASADRLIRVVTELEELDGS